MRHERLLAVGEKYKLALKYRYSWFGINFSGCGGQCQPLTLAGPDNGINNIFFNRNANLPRNYHLLLTQHHYILYNKIIRG